MGIGSANFLASLVGFCVLFTKIRHASASAARVRAWMLFVGDDKISSVNSKLATDSVAVCPVEAMAITACVHAPCTPRRVLRLFIGEVFTRSFVDCHDLHNPPTKHTRTHTEDNAVRRSGTSFTSVRASKSAAGSQNTSHASTSS